MEKQNGHEDFYRRVYDTFHALPSSRHMTTMRQHARAVHVLELVVTGSVRPDGLSAAGTAAVDQLAAVLGVSEEKPAPAPKAAKS